MILPAGRGNVSPEATLCPLDFHPCSTPCWGKFHGNDGAGRSDSRGNPVMPGLTRHPVNDVSPPAYDMLGQASATP